MIPQRARSLGLLPFAFGLLPLLAAPGCDHDPAPAPRCGALGEPPCSCADAHKRPSGVCCPTWTAPNPAGECLFQRWSLPSATDAVGLPGTILGQLFIDSNGAALASWGSPTPSGLSEMEIGEELSRGFWVSHPVSTALAGRTGSSYLAIGPDATAMFIWVEALLDEGIYVSERDSFGRWKDPVPGDSLSFPRGAVEPSIASSPSGEWLAVWSQFTTTGTGAALARRRSFADPWERPAAQDDVLSVPIFFVNAALIATDPHGDALIAWYQSNGGTLKTWVSERKGPGGAFTRPGMNDFLSPPEAPVASGKPDNPMPALGPRGEAAVVWSQEDGAGQTSVYLATREPGGPWQKPNGLGDTFSPHAGITRGAVLAFGPQGDLHVVWSQRDKGNEVVYAARRAPNGHWIDRGTSPVQLSSPGTLAYSPALAIGPEGGVVVAWMETIGTRSRVLARRTGSDRRTWTAIEPLSDDALGNAGGPVVAVGPGDRALCGWTQGPFDRTQVYFASLR